MQISQFKGDKLALPMGMIKGVLASCLSPILKLYPPRVTTQAGVREWKVSTVALLFPPREWNHHESSITLLKKKGFFY